MEAAVSPSDVLIDVRAPDKVHLLRELSRRAASVLKLNAEGVSGEILKREALGSTGVGAGVAIPHARIQGLKQPFGVLARLRKAIEFEAIDSQLVDIAFFLLLPAEGEQLNALACVARKLRDPEAVGEIRRKRNSVDVHHAW